MSKILIITHDSNEQSYPIEKERIILGRGQDCDIKLDNEGMSRQHAAITFRFNAIYIENLSSTGQILKNGAPVEYSQLEEKDEIVIGPYCLYWTEKRNHENAPPNQENSSDVEQEQQNFAPPPQSFDSDQGNFAIDQEKTHASIEMEVPSLDVNAEPHQDAPQENFQLPALNMANDSFHKANAIDDSPSSIGESPTNVLTSTGPYAVLKVLKGEDIGREIRLHHGVQWTVGRGAGCEAQVQNPKLSRSHFRIVKIGNGYRLQDLGSSNGTRLNGVAVSDAPLQVFDTLKAGPVELQFTIVDPKHLPALEMKSSHGIHEEKTAFSPPVPMYAQGGSAKQSSPKSHSEDYNYQTPKGETSYNREEPPQNPKVKIEAVIHKVKIFWGEQPKQRKLLYVIAATILLMLMLVPKGEDDIALSKTETQENTESPEINAANSSNISPEFNLKSEEEKKRIEELYLEAQKARSRRDWEPAFNAAAAILDPKTGVKKYKDTAEILDEAQTYLNESQVGTLSKSVSALQDAKLRSEEQVSQLVASGEKAIKEARWDDAEETFSKAIYLDPNNQKAKNGFAAAIARNSSAASNDEIPDEPISESDPNQELVMDEEKEIEGIQKQYQDAKMHIHEGNYRKAVPTLNALERHLAEKIDTYMQEDGRLPASQKTKLTSQTRALLSLVNEAKDRVNSEFRMEYQGQMSDAEVAISNKQFVQAREIYDNIIRRDPDYSEPNSAREKLYALILREAKNKYHEGLIYESVGDLPSALDSFEKTVGLLENVNQYTATQYRNKATAKLEVLKE